MGMQLVITSRGSSAPLSLELAGYRLELSGLPEGRRLTIAGEGGGLAVRIAEAEQVR